MNDMTAVIIPRSDQMNSDDLIAGPRTITIREMQIRPGTEQPVSVFFQGDNGKPYKPCKSMCRVMTMTWGSDAKEYAGRSMTLYRDATIKWGGLEVGGIRISHMTHIDAPVTFALTATKGSRKPFTVKPLTITDKVADGVQALVARIDAAERADLDSILAEPGVEKQRHWLVQNRADLADTVTLAIARKQGYADVE